MSLSKYRTAESSVNFDSNETKQLSAKFITSSSKSVPLGRPVSSIISEPAKRTLARYSMGNPFVSTHHEVSNTDEGVEALTFAFRADARPLPHPFNHISHPNLIPPPKVSAIEAPSLGCISSIAPNRRTAPPAPTAGSPVKSFDYQFGISKAISTEKILESRSGNFQSGSTCCEDFASPFSDAKSTGDAESDFDSLVQSRNSLPATCDALNPSSDPYNRPPDLFNPPSDPFNGSSAPFTPPPYSFTPPPPLHNAPVQPVAVSPGSKVVKVCVRGVTKVCVQCCFLGN